MKRYKIGSYLIVIQNEDSNVNISFPYSAYMYKGNKCITGFRSKQEISEDTFLEFIFDNKLLRNEFSIVDQL